MSKIDRAACQITAKSEKGYTTYGTGFFIKKDLILTCAHVINADFEENDQIDIIEILNCDDQNGLSLTARLVAKCDTCDCAILQLNEDFSSVAILNLYNSEVTIGEKINIFGYPSDSQGLAIGEDLNGKIARFIEDSRKTVYDTILDLNNFDGNTKYEGFSGSPVVNEYDQVISIVKHQGARDLGSVSIKKAAAFLEKNNLEILQYKPTRKVLVVDEEKITLIGNLKLEEFYIPRFFSKKTAKESSVPSDKTSEGLQLSKIFEKEDKIVLLGNPGIGKTTELKRFAQELWKTGETADFVPIHQSLRNFTYSSAIDDYLPSRWKELHKVIFILDGIDEIANIDDFISKLEIFISQNTGSKKTYKYLISCRTNVYHSIVFSVSDFNVYSLEDLNLKDSLQLLKNKCGDIVGNLDFESSLSNFLKTPFQIDILASYINEKKQLPASVTSLWQKYISGRLSHDHTNKLKKINLRVPLIKKWSAKVGLINELMRRTLIDEDDLYEILAHNTQEYDEFKKNPLLNKTLESTQYYFEHRNIQEYFAAYSLNKMSADKIIDFLTIDKSIRKTQPSLFNTITFLITILDDTKYEAIVSWLIENETELLFKADSDRSGNYKIDVFKQYFDTQCIKKSYWIDSNRILTVKEIADFGNSPENFEYLMGYVTKADCHFRVVISALELLNHFTIPPNENENFKKDFFKLLAAPEISEMIKSHILQCIYHHDLHDDDSYLRKIFDLFKDETSKEINRNLISLIQNYENMDEFFWFIEAEFLRETGIIKRKTEDKVIRGTSWVLELIIPQLKKAENFISLAKYYFDETKNISGHNDFYNILIERCLFFETSNQDFLVHLLSSFEDQHKFFYRENILMKLILDSNLDSQFKAFDFIIEKSQFRNIERILGMSTNEKNIDYIIGKYISGTLAKDRIDIYRNAVEIYGSRELAEYFTKEMLSRNFTFNQPFLNQKEFEEVKEQPQKKKQENFDLLFNEDKLLSKINNIFEEFGNPINSNNITEIKENWHYKNGYTKNIDISYSLLGNIVYDAADDILFEHVERIFKFSTILFEEIKKQIQGQQNSSSKIEISGEQVQYIKNWTLKTASEINFNEVAQYVDSNTYRILKDYKKLDLVLYFTATLDFELEQEFLLKSVKFTDIENFTEGEKNSEVLKLKIKERLFLDKQVSENLIAGNLFYNVLDNHIQYALDKELSITYPKIKEYFLNAETSYNVDNKLAQFIQLTHDKDLLKEMCNNVLSFNCWSALKLLMEMQTEQKFCKNKAVEYLELEISDEKNYHYSTALSILFELNSILALKYVSSSLKAKRMPSFRDLSYKNYDAIKSYSILKTLFEEAYVKNREEIGFNSLSSFMTVYVSNLSKSRSNYKKVQKELDAIKNRFETSDSKNELFHINQLIDYSNKSYINSQSRALSFSEAVEKVNQLA